MHIEIGIVKLSGGSPGTIASDFVRSMMSPHKPAVLNLCRRPYGSGKEVPNKESLSYINMMRQTKYPILLTADLVFINSEHKQKLN